MRDIDGEILKLKPHQVTKILTRAVASKTPEENIQTVINPTVSSAQGFCEAITKHRHTNARLVNLSSTAASIPSLDNPYANARRYADEAVKALCDEAGISGSTLRVDLVCDPSLGKKGENHLLSYPVMLTQMPVQPVVRTQQDSVISIQPIHIDDLTCAILTEKPTKEPSYDVIVAAGPKAYTQKEAFELYGKLYDIKPTYIILNKMLVDWYSKHFGFGQLLYGVDILKHRDENPEYNKPFDHNQLQLHISKELQPLEDTHEVCKKDPNWTSGEKGYSATFNLIKKFVEGAVKKPISMIELAKLLPKIVSDET
jgi:nucleoside-diphosphate-sugar epimerase